MDVEALSRHRHVRFFFFPPCQDVKERNYLWKFAAIVHYAPPFTDSKEKLN